MYTYLLFVLEQLQWCALTLMTYARIVGGYIGTLIITIGASEGVVLGGAIAPSLSDLGFEL